MFHVTEDDGELYAVRRFDEIADLDAFDHHLLWCEECQRQMVWTEQYLRMLRTALLEMKSTVGQATSPTPAPGPQLPTALLPRK
jgi:hypothetical protein